MFDYIHLILFAFGLLSGFWKVGNLSLLMDPVKYSDSSKKYSLEKIIGLAIISLFWIFYGIYKGVNENFIILEVATFSILLIAFISKINFTKSTSFLGHKIPGHGKPETKLQKIIKYFLLAFLILIPVIAMLVSIKLSNY
jgi:hypothetical protein